MTRAVLLNNPANLPKGHNWMGVVENPDERIYATFESFFYGIRALVQRLRSFVQLYHCHTLVEFIGRWAPEATIGGHNAYVEYVAKVFETSTEPPAVPFTYRFSLDDFAWRNGKTSDALYLLCFALCFIETGYGLGRKEFDDVVIHCYTGILPEDRKGCDKLGSVADD